MIDKAFVPPDAAGWMVRVRIPVTTEEFYLVAIPDEAAPVEAVRTGAGCLANETVEGVGTLTAQDLREQKLGSGQIKHA